MQTNDASAHLSDEKFSDILAGETSAEVQAHLAACAECSAEAARLSQAFADFSVQSRTWAERRAATQPRLSANRGKDTNSLPASRLWAATLCALALVFAAGTATRLRHHGSVLPANATATVFKAPVSPETLKSDNALLSAIDGEVTTQESAPAASVYRIGSASHTEPRRSARKAVNE
jgi:anti-sigma factor RsiW